MIESRCFSIDDLGAVLGRKQQAQIYLDRLKAQQANSGQAVLVPSEFVIDRREIFPPLQEGRNAMERARGAKNWKEYAEAALFTAQMAGRLLEIEDLVKEADEWQLNEIGK